jgi:hypothetical protein
MPPLDDQSNQIRQCTRTKPNLDRWRAMTIPEQILVWPVLKAV